MFAHQDVLAAINQNVRLDQKFEYIHRAMGAQFPFIHRIASAVYDPKTDILKTFIHSSGGAEPLNHYQARLADSASLMEILEKGKPRVVNDLGIFHSSRQEHTKKIAAGGYGASYTMPMYNDGKFFGFLFFDSHDTEPFTETVLQRLDPYGHLISLVIINELGTIENLLASVKVARDFCHTRDDETGAHQDRMSRYARLIARKISDKFGLSDEQIERIFIYSPLHDIGKLGIPDRILFKPDKLTEEEFEVMKSHTKIGRELVDCMLDHFSFSGNHQTDILKNIAEFHHEAVDGSGYPEGRVAADIPIEARIVAVADVFDALTSARPYKEAWDIDKAFDTLNKLAGIKLDGDCVDALVCSREEVEQIQQQFLEDSIG